MIVLSKVEEKMEERERLLGQAEFNLELQGWGHIVETHVETGRESKSSPLHLLPGLPDGQSTGRR